jgi:hypothetical protein
MTTERTEVKDDSREMSDDKGMDKNEKMTGRWKVISDDENDNVRE